MSKTLFNDTRPNRLSYKTTCASCRCEIELKVINYPHGPQDVLFCAVCGTDIIKEKNGTVTITMVDYGTESEYLSR